MISRSMFFLVMAILLGSFRAGSSPCFVSAVAAQALDSTVSLGEGTVVGENVNVRGRPSLSSEVITRVKRGEKVTVLEEITSTRGKADEPVQWYRIALPPNTPVWVHGDYVNAEVLTTKTRLNLRGGPGENYSILGRIEKGTLVSEIQRKGEWIEIQPPPGAFAYVAADLVEFIGSFVARAKAAGSEVVAASVPPSKELPSSIIPPNLAVDTKSTETKEPTEADVKTEVKEVAPEPPLETPVTVITTEKVVGVPIDASNPSKETPIVIPDPRTESANPTAARTGTPPTESIETRVALATSPTPATATTTPSTPEIKMAIEQPEPWTGDPSKAPRRLVTREGIVSGTFFNSIQSPTFFGLRTLQDGRLMNYLHGGKLGLKLDAFKGRKVLISGEEFIDKRWPKIPVLEIETIEAAP